MSGRQIYEAAVVRDAPIPEQPGKESQATRGNRGVDIWLLPIKRLGGAARRQAVPLIPSPMNDRGEEFVHARQALRTIFMVFPQWLAEYELAAIRQVAGIQPIVEVS